MLGFTTRDRIRVIWGDTDIAPSSDEWFGGRTITLQGAAICSAADKLRKDLLDRAATILKVDAAKLQIRDGVISSTEDPAKQNHLRRAGESQQRRHPPNRPRRRRRPTRRIEQRRRRLLRRGGSGHLDRQLAFHPSGLRARHRPGDQSAGGRGRHGGSLVESTQVTTDAIPWDREFPGTRHYSVGYLSYRLPTIMDVPQQTQLYIDSLEPRWFYGVKSFSETSIGAVPGAIANAIYNACGVRIREHPITREKIMAGLSAKARPA